MSNYVYGTVLNNIKNKFHFECEELKMYFSFMSFKVNNEIINISMFSRNSYQLLICDIDSNLIFIFEFKTQKELIEKLNNSLM